VSGNAKPTDLSIGVFADDQLDRVQHAYGLRSLLVLPFFALNGSIIDLRRRTETARKALLETERGVLFLKELPWYCSSERFAHFQSELLAGLADEGATVVAPLATASGRRFFHDRLTGSIFLLQPYLDGRSWTGGVEEARSAGTALAALHDCGSRVTSEAFPGMRDVFASARELVGLLPDNWSGPASARGDVASLADSALAAVDRCRREAYAAGYGRAVVPVHGDYNPFNIVFDPGSSSVTAIVDFDNACLDDRAHDLGEALVRFAWVNYRGLSSAYGAVPSAFDLDAVKAVLNGYREYDEAAARAARPRLPAVMTAVALELAAIGLLSSYYTADDVSALQRNVESLLPMANDAVAAVW